jgi:hypothetical protein
MLPPILHHTPKWLKLFISPRRWQGEKTKGKEQKCHGFERFLLYFLIFHIIL